MRRGVLGALALALVGVVALSGPADAGVASAGGGRGSDPLTVRTEDGLLEGTASGAMDEYLGIPYAAPPTGDLRWEPPAPAAHWTGVRPATAFGANCAQPGTPFGTASTSEDCLFLNVYTPRNASVQDSRLPVLVWIHGGAFDYGEGSDYDPAPLVARGIIVVTLNYRLGALGFLADTSLADPRTGAAGDYGLMDQQAALRWVQANVGRFGGDRHAVTLSGESAGGLSTLAQMTSPGARGLFARAIVESGTYTLTQFPLAAAESAGQAFAAQAGCADNSASCLRALPVSTILADENHVGYRPDVDGVVQPRTLRDAFATGQVARIPVLLGTNHDEFSFFVAQEQLLEHLPPVTAADYVPYIAASLSVSAPIAATIAARYPVSAYPSAALALTAAGTDGIFACNALTADEGLSNYVPVYAYEFNDENAPQRFLPTLDFPYGAAHASELQYLFDLTAPIPAPLSPAQQTLAAQMQRYWTDFVKDARPSSPRLPRWPAFHTGTQAMMSLDTPRPSTETGFAAEHQCSFWDAAG